MKRTKIVCTIGPASSSPAMLTKMIDAGMNVARMNMSHGTYPQHRALIASVRAAAKKSGHMVGLLVDLQGPKIRVGDLPKAGVELVAGRVMVFSTDPKAAAPTRIPVTYPHLHRDVHVGDHVLMDDGLMDAVITKVKGRDVYAKIITGGVLTSHKGFNLPQTKMRISALSKKDYDDARFGIQQGADWIALSFVRTAGDVLELQRFIAKHRGDAKVIVKIEKPEALVNFDAILAVTDAVMVARGDLGVEIPAEQVPIAQKMMIKKCLAAGKPVVVATQMLDSMIRNPRPTRAEVSDIANAVIDHADAVMLSGETATGKYPLEAVKVMARTAEEAERSHYDDLAPSMLKETETVRAAVAGVAGLLAERVQAKAVVVATQSGDTARYLSRARPELPILAATPTARAAGQLTISWGVIPFIVPMVPTVNKLLALMRVRLRASKLSKKGDRLVLVAGKWQKQSEYVLQVLEV